MRIETERMLLRWLTLDDAPLMLAVWNDPAFVQNVGDRGIRTVAEARDALSDGALKLYRDLGYGPFRVALRENDEGIGVCGLFKREHLDDPDIGFGLLPDYCGKGLGWEAAAAVLAHSRDTLRLLRVTAIVSPDNVRSIALIEKLGMHFERSLQMPGEDHTVSLYGIDW